MNRDRKTSFKDSYKKITNTSINTSGVDPRNESGYFDLLSSDSEFDEQQRLTLHNKEKGCCCGHSFKYALIWISYKTGLRQDNWPEYTVLHTYNDPISHKDGPLPTKGGKIAKGTPTNAIQCHCGSLFSFFYRIVLAIIFGVLFIPLFNRETERVVQSDLLGSPSKWYILDRIIPLEN